MLQMKYDLNKHFYCSFPELVCIAPNDRPITLLNTGKYLVVPCMDGVLYFYKGVLPRSYHAMCNNCCSSLLLWFLFLKFLEKSWTAASMRKSYHMCRSDQIWSHRSSSCGCSVTEQGATNFQRRPNGRSVPVWWCGRRYEIRQIWPGRRCSCFSLTK